MDRWCQNKRCVDKKNQSQIRGSKGNKYYQSYKARPYYNYMFCGQRCQDQWFNDNWEVCLRTVGEIPKQVLPLDDAWYVEYDYGRYRYDSEAQEGRYTNQGWFPSHDRSLASMSLIVSYFQSLCICSGVCACSCVIICLTPRFLFLRNQP